MLREQEEEEQKREELERLQAEVEEKQRQATELVTRFRDRVSNFYRNLIRHLPFDLHITSTLYQVDCHVTEFMKWRGCNFLKS
jgi:hypothetical protein